jgi:hypothetical protein
MNLALLTAALRDAQHDLDYALCNWEQFSPAELGAVAARWWNARRELRDAITEPVAS